MTSCTACYAAMLTFLLSVCPCSILCVCWKVPLCDIIYLYLHLPRIRTWFDYDYLYLLLLGPPLSALWTAQVSMPDVAEVARQTGGCFFIRHCLIFSISSPCHLFVKFKIVGRAALFSPFHIYNVNSPFENSRRSASEQG